MRRRIEALEKEPVRALAVIVRAREEERGAVGERLSDDSPCLVVLESGVLSQNLAAIDLSRFAGDDIDDAEERVIAINHRAGTANDFHPVN